jgi:hypothetical protein
MLSIDDLQRLLATYDGLALSDIKSIMLRARYDEADLEDVEYANSLIPESGDYLPSHLLSALIRADLSEMDAAPYIEQNKAFFVRLVYLVSDLVRYFEPCDPRDVIGVLSCIDDCHNDYNISAKSLRKDRLAREAQQSLANALDAVTRAGEALESAKKHLRLEYEEYHRIYYRSSSARSQSGHDIEQLIDELKLCSGILNVVGVTAASDADYLLLSGNDKRTVLVDYAYMMSLMWNGPKLITTPGSDFSNFCSLLFEAVTGVTGESLAGAINRYARSDERKKKDADHLESEAYESTDDNFITEKRAMEVSAREIKRIKYLLDAGDLSDFARVLLLMKLNQETKNYEAARDTSGPRQVWLHQLNEDQLEKLGGGRIDPRAMAKLDRALGDARRAVRGKGFDV